MPEQDKDDDQKGLDNIPEISKDWDIFIGTDPKTLKLVLETLGMEASDLVGNIIYASEEVPSRHPLMIVKWLFQFHFSPEGKLEKVLLEKAFIAP